MAKKKLDAKRFEEELQGVQDSMEFLNELSPADDLHEICEFLLATKGDWKRLEEERKLEAKPYDEKKKMVQNHFKPVLDAYAGVEDLLKGKLLDLVYAIDQKRAEALVAAQEAFQTEDLESARNLLMEAGKGVELGKGITVRRSISFDIVDYDAVPKKFLEPAKEVIAAYIKNEGLEAGAEFDGIKVVNKYSIVVTSPKEVESENN